MSATTTFPTTDAGWCLQQSYLELPDLFYTRVMPTAVKVPRVVVLNRPLAERLGLNPDALSGQEAAEILAGNRLAPGSTPIAQAYAGHQYGHFTPLGDGRALLLGEQVAPDGRRFDVQLKGSGPTPYSRRGDGRAVLGPMLREYVISEAMHALGIPTTRSLAVTATGEDVWRQERHPGAVLTRIAASHIRVGTFEWAAAHRDQAALRALADYTLRRHCAGLEPSANPALALLEAAAARQAALVAQWMLVGFVHGVMNTDNMALSGETIDYGPCAFIDAYDPGAVFSSIDAHGRYAYGNQPRIAQWNLTRLAEALLPVLHPVEKDAMECANRAIGGFGPAFEREWLAGMRRKLGLFNEEADDSSLVAELLSWMQTAKADYTSTFVALSDEGSALACMQDAAFGAWKAKWQARLARQSRSAVEARALQREANPVFIPRNHQVEAALTAAEEGDLSLLNRLLDVVAKPFDYERNAPEFRTGAPAEAGPYRTFCGT